MSNSSDYVISNQAGAGFRNELNTVLGDIKSLNSGPAQSGVTPANQGPANKSAHMLWADTTNNLLKVRNGSNNGWITLGDLSAQLGMASLSASNVQSFTGTIQTAGEIISNANTRLKMPVGPTSQRPFSPTQGDTRLNSTTKLLEAFSGTSWFSMFSGAKLDVFNSSGTFTPAEGRTNFLVVCTGGGGGGAGVTVHGSPSNYWGASGGGGAGTAIKMYSLTEMGSSASVTVGTGGAATSGYSHGNNGVDSSFNPSGTGVTITGQKGTAASAGYASATATAMSRPGWPGHGVNGDVNCKGEKAEFQTINNYTGATPSGIAVTDMRSSGGGTFWGKGPGAGADGVWSSTNAVGYAGTNGVVVVLSW